MIEGIRVYGENISSVGGSAILMFLLSCRNYDVSLPHNKIRKELCELAKEMAAPAMSAGEEFQPEAAIVNYLVPSDMLGGHLDVMEADWSKPIVSISLACKAIFLLGGKSREDIPIAMFLRNGDVCAYGWACKRMLSWDKKADLNEILASCMTI
ncbi:hypothetical protein Cni_G21611 [Canna indica]|uniref:Alpha-ketoglutarate-dependent dioxygenase AlkB-like domain-containing protein n=1 Tax=Canna indica TaxID=4628 RepID=A0AAQ3KPU3_9LILI|nr:hypothetical protein Cni_G21611 [Canna indica]